MPRLEAISRRHFKVAKFERFWELLFGDRLSTVAHQLLAREAQRLIATGAQVRSLGRCEFGLRFCFKPFLKLGASGNIHRNARFVKRGNPLL